MTELVRAQGRAAFWGTLLMWRVARACSRECVAPRETEAGAVTDSRSPLLLRPPQGFERESPPEYRDPWGVEDKRSHPKNRGSMTVGLGGLGPPVAPQSGRPHSGGLPDRAPGSLVKDPGSKRQDAHTQLVWAAKTSRKHDTAL